MALVGTASDEVDEILAAGRSGVTTLYVSMSRRDPQGADADYLAWHALDHRPEQHRLAALRSSLRIVSTPACRAARAVSDARLDATDHVMAYFFADASGLAGFTDLSTALRGAGRMPIALPAVERGVYEVRDRRAAPRIKIGADVLPWWPAVGVYLLVERGRSAPTRLIDVPGVAGTWSAVSLAADPALATAEVGQWITCCFLDADPVAAAHRLRPALEQHWSETGATPLLAAPFHTVAAREWQHHLP